MEGVEDRRKCCVVLQGRENVLRGYKRRVNDIYNNRDLCKGRDLRDPEKQGNVGITETRIKALRVI